MVQGQNTFIQTSQNKPKTLSQYLSTDGIQKMLDGAFPTKEAKARFVADILSIYGQNPKLKDCDLGSILSAGLHGVSLNLSLALQQYGIVPRGGVAKCDVQYQGYAQLAIRTGEYAKIKVYEVYEGEYKGRDRLTRDPIFEWYVDDDERESHPIIGYYAFYILKDGREDSIYWTHKAILKHADTYAPSFSLEKYNKLLNGELDQKEADKLRGGTPWYDYPDAEAHKKMCRKTVLKQLLKTGFAPLSAELRQVLAEEDAGDSLITAEDVALGVTPTVAAEYEETVETPAEASETAQNVPPAPDVPVDATPAAKRGRPRKIAPPVEDDGFNEASFFGEG